MNIGTQFITSLRMLTSGKTTGSARFFEKGSANISEIKRNAGFSDDRITNLEADTGIEALKNQHFFEDGQLFEIKEKGIVITAPSPAMIDKLVESGEPSASEKPLMQGRLAGKVAVVTGAAQGFGQGIAQSLFDEGASVVVADINDEGGQAMADELNQSQCANRAVFFHCDVGDYSSVERMVTQVVHHFGGVDILISNAGILRAGGLDEMEPAIFDQMTRVNYNAFFYCAKAVSPVMKWQTSLRAGYFADIVQINSKSGLKGSNKNFAYAGAKFGGLGLTQSFALELMPHRIKVNAICPGNFFEGPLWSDPEKGLFVQYLAAGKVPGAKSVDEVKRHYESQVPAGRGCRVKDVVRAILYAIEQEYETGQAIPVTGGQNMLS